MKASSLILGLMTAALVAGCSRVEVEPRVQQVPKQPRPIMAAAQAASGGEVGWVAPKSWTPIPAGQMRLAAFQVSQKNPAVLMTVIPLAGDAGGVLANVNRWETQVGINPPTAAGDLDKVVKHMQVKGKPIDVIDVTGPATANPRQRTLGAILPYADRTFYFKLTGPEEIVAAEKANFDAFIQSIHFDAAAPPAAPQEQQAGAPVMPPLPEGHPVVPGAANPPLPEGHPALPGGAQVAVAMPDQPEELTYTAPQGWIKEPPLPLRAVSFHVGDGEKRVDVIVSKLPAVGTGSYAENITRWRSQVNLPPLAQGEQQLSTPVLVGGADSAMFDFVGPGDVQRAKRMLLGWVPKGDSWWFFKLLGPADAVGEQQKNFDEFMKSVKFIEPKS